MKVIKPEETMKPGKLLLTPIQESEEWIKEYEQIWDKNPRDITEVIEWFEDKDKLLKAFIRKQRIEAKLEVLDEAISKISGYGFEHPKFKTWDDALGYLAGFKTTIK